MIEDSENQPSAQVPGKGHALSGVDNDSGDTKSGNTELEIRKQTKEDEAASCAVTVVRPGRPFWHFKFEEVWKYRYMLLYLIRRDIVVLYKQTILGPAWVILQPLFMSFLFSIIFGRIAKVGTDGIPGFLFYFGSNVFWSFLAGTYDRTSTIFMKAKDLMGKVYFPRLIIPFAGLGGSLFKLAIQSLFLTGIILCYLLGGSHLNPLHIGILWLPLVILQLSLIGLGVGFLFAWATVKYRDLSIIGNLFVQGWMYLSAVAYPISEVDPKFGTWLHFNPVASAMELGRHAIFGTPFPSLSLLGSGLGITLAVFVVGLFTFNVTQRKFIDVV